jgi:Sulfatase
VAFQGQGGGLPAAEWTLASVLKTAGYNTYFTGKWHLGESDYALPTAQGYDEMKYVGLYHLNAYTYSDPKWFPTMPAALREMYQKVTTGMLSGVAGGKAVEQFKLNGEYVDTPVIDGKPGVVGIPFVDQYIEKGSMELIEKGAKSGKPFFISINFMKVHQPNLPAPEFIGKSISKSKYADSLVENDTRIGRVTCSGPPTTARGRMSIPMPATRRSAAPRAPIERAAPAFRRSRGAPASRRARRITRSWAASITWPRLPRWRASSCPRRTAQASRSSSTATTFRPSCSAPDPARATPGTTSPRTSCRQARSAGTSTSSCSTCAATTGRSRAASRWTPTSDGRDRTSTWMGPVMGEQLQKVMKTFVDYPPRKLQSDGYTGPITITNYQKFEWLRESLKKDGFNLGLPGQ